MNYLRKNYNKKKSNNVEIWKNFGYIICFKYENWCNLIALMEVMRDFELCEIGCQCFGFIKCELFNVWGSSFA